MTQSIQTMSTNRSPFIICFNLFFLKNAKSNLKIYQMLTNSNLRFQAHLQRIGEDRLMVFDCFSTARSFLKFHPVFACLRLLKSLRL